MWETPERPHCSATEADRNLIRISAYIAQTFSSFILIQLVCVISQFQNYSNDTAVSHPAFQSLSFIKWVLSSTQQPLTAPIPMWGIDYHPSPGLQLNRASLMILCTCCNPRHVDTSVNDRHQPFMCEPEMSAKDMRPGKCHIPHAGGKKGFCWNGTLGQMWMSAYTHTHTLTVCVYVSVYVSTLMSITLHILPLLRHGLTKVYQCQTIILFFGTNVKFKKRVLTGLTYPECRAALPSVKNFNSAFSVVIF